MPLPRSSPRPPPHYENALLASLPFQELSRLRPRLTRLSVPPGTLLQDADAPCTRILFVESGVLTLLGAADAAGRSVAVAIIGRESAAGLLGVLQPHLRSIVRIVSQSRAIVHSAPIAGLLNPATSPALAALVGTHVERLVAQLVVATTCASLHTTPQRLARLLLMTRDRGEDADITYTQHALAAMLGVRRASVNTALARLETRGAIHTSRGHVHIHDTTRLEAAACPCYQRLHHLTAQSSPAVASPTPPGPAPC